MLQLVAEGMMNKEIALETSIRNVEKYVSRLFIKTGRRTELVRFALEHGVHQVMPGGWRPAPSKCTPGLPDRVSRPRPE